MGIYKNLNPEDVSLRSFEVHKEFTFSNNDSGSGVYGIRAISGSNYNFQLSTANSQSFGEYNSISASMGKKPYDATFYELPLYFTINNMFYRDTNVVDSSEIDLTHWEKTNSPRKAFRLRHQSRWFMQGSSMCENSGIISIHTQKSWKV